ncbi:hypothetical protein ACFT30_09780 [Microbacterium ureisolvens]|uniref:hypothetical protein n=1 Tax=Microbacterium ureisolvens TaxID=2781186 RepID=UPI003643B46B
MTLTPPWMDGIPFTITEGRAAGLSYGRMRGRSFQRPFHGVRVVGSSGRIDGGLIDECAALRTVLPEGAAFSHSTAARLWNMPLPPWLSDELHVLTPGRAEIRRPRVIGWRRATDLEIRIADGLPVTSPADTWVLLATMTHDRGGRLGRRWLVAIGDFLISGTRTRYGRTRPLASAAELAQAVRAHGSRRGARDVRWALEHVRSPVDSPPESFVRLGLVDAGLPEPTVQPAIRTRIGVRHPDLGYVEERVLLEYLGDVHRSDRETWLKDLQRVQLFEDAGYRVIMLGSADLTPAGMRALSLRVRRALSRP